MFMLEVGNLGDEFVLSSTEKKYEIGLIKVWHTYKPGKFGEK